MALTDSQKKKLIALEQLETFKNSLSTANDGKYYQKPADGIPATDLATAVQNALTAADTALQPDDLDTLSGKVTALESLMTEGDNPTAAIDKFSEIVAFLDKITNTQTLDGILDGINTAIAAKYAKPTGGIPKSDLASDVQTSLGKADTAVQPDDISGKADKSEMSVSSTGDKTTITLKNGTSATVLNAHQDISGKADKSEMSVTPGTGTNADKTTIQLKAGTSATVLTEHQTLDIATNADIAAIF